MKKKLFILSCLFCFSLIFPNISKACDYIKSPWYKINNVIDQTSLPNNITVNYQDSLPTLQNLDTEEVLVVDNQAYGETYENIPNGFRPVYRLTKNKVEKFDSYKKMWENTNTTTATIYPDYLDSNPSHYNNSNSGYGRPNNQPLPKDDNLTLFLVKGGTLLPIRVYAKYSLNPSYDPYLEKRPDRLCGDNLSENNNIFNSVFYFILMNLNLLFDAKTTKEILQYDLSQHTINSITFIAIWIFVGVSVFWLIKSLIKKNKKIRQSLITFFN